ncbi:DNA helicase [Sphaerisporangium krabiense]|uniref:DNA helicase IV n=1 Tax=Sphaerisporangium krabiense TaxID=763782 RepID=A0A7W9DP69_9ACTN|nr:ATP-binding domain-containing protein [Sphaerisporangium krabiense]MBB5625000.1 DNA helicase IV [Sphaerisporangium krabiense]GII66960.1 DNA helicase [Sphaerisporangium krabiense]
MEHRASESARAEALRAEQSYVSMLYDRLDATRERAEASLRGEHGRGTEGGTHQARLERDVSAAEHARQVSRLSSIERGLCFGRIDDTGGERYYIGRASLRDARDELVLIDWRAPAARPFYTATPSDPGPLVRRRHLHTRGRTVVHLDDEVFDLARMSEPERRALVGEAALLAALRRGRTGRMGDVVATIQAEQDRVIRSGLPGVLVVQGAPGTGKTVAALHRAAYLLYTHRETLERRGVLVVGPNTLFLRYIGQVLPSLGETDVVLTTVGELFPGVRATAHDSPEAAVVKGGARMAEVVRAAVRDRQRVPEGDLTVMIDVRTSVRDGVEVVVERMPLRVDHATCVRARDRARAVRNPHNIARKLFVDSALTALALDEARQLDLPMDEEDLRYARATLWSRPEVREALDALWPLLTPQRLVAELLSDPALLRAASSGPDGEPLLSPRERRALLRPAGSPWTTGDVPLLDEAAELLGEDDAARKAAAREDRRRRDDERAYARGVLEINELTEVMDARALAERNPSDAATLTTAERAAGDREWVYGHVIVDEAQELSAMAWRTVMRRVPTRSLTVVGDVAQTGSAAGARSWAQVLDPYVKGRWREARLLVNYRTPAEIMAVAADVLAAVDPGQAPPISVRDGEAPPRAVRAARPELATVLPELVRAELALVTGDGAGRLGVLTPDARHAEVAALLPEAASALSAEALDAPSVVLTVTQAKGLEFDAVIVVAPDEILTQGPKGGQDLYVAITRATRRLTVVHETELPPMLARLRD